MSKNEILDNFGNISGYRYAWGQAISFPFEADDVIYVEEDAIVSDVDGEEPNEQTVGVLGQYFYNVHDLKLYRCVNFGQCYYQWELQEYFTYPKNGTKKVVVKENTYPIEFSMYNTRGEKVLTKELDRDTKVLYITEEEAENIIPDIYDFLFVANREIKYCKQVVIVDTRNAFNKDINVIEGSKNEV